MERLPSLFVPLNLPNHYFRILLWSLSGGEGQELWEINASRGGGRDAVSKLTSFSLGTGPYLSAYHPALLKK